MKNTTVKRMNQRVKIGNVEIDNITDTIRIVRGDGETRTEFLISCTTCGRENWSELDRKNETDASGWFSTRITADDQIAFCPNHSREGLGIALEARERTDTIAREAIGKCQDLPGLNGMKTTVPVRRNPPGIYSKTTAQWLASMPTGKTSRYWDLKNIHFSHLVRQQGRVNFPDLMEMRAWTILFRHADMTWSLVEHLWLELSQRLDTPYPLSDLRFLREHPALIEEFKDRLAIRENPGPRLDQFGASLEHDGPLPALWNISHDLGVRDPAWPVIADPEILEGEPHLQGTCVSLRAIRKLHYQGDMETEEIAWKTGISAQQAEAAVLVSDLLDVRAWPAKMAWSMLGP